LSIIQAQDFSHVLPKGPVELTALTVKGDKLFTCITDGKHIRILVSDIGRDGPLNFLHTSIRPSGRVDKIAVSNVGLALAAASPQGHTLEIHHYSTPGDYKTYDYRYRVTLENFVDVIGYDDMFAFLDGGKFCFIGPNGHLSYSTLTEGFAIETPFTGLCELSDAVIIGTEGGSVFRAVKQTRLIDRHARAESHEAHCAGLTSAPTNSMQAAGGRIYFYGPNAMLRVYDTKTLDRVAKIDLMSTRTALPLPSRVSSTLMGEMLASGMSEENARSLATRQDQAYADVSDIVHMTMMTNTTAVVVFRDAMIVVLDFSPDTGSSSASDRATFRVLAHTQSMAPAEAVFLRGNDIITMRTGENPACVNLYRQGRREETYHAQVGIERPRTALICGNYAAFYIAREDVQYNSWAHGLDDATRAFIRVLRLDRDGGEQADICIIELLFSEPLRHICAGQPRQDGPFLFFSRTATAASPHADKACYCAKCYFNAPDYKKHELSGQVLALGCQKEDSYAVHAVVAPGAIVSVNFEKDPPTSTQLLSGLDILRVYGFYVDTAGRFAVLMCDLRGTRGAVPREPVRENQSGGNCSILVITLGEDSARIINVIPVEDFPVAAKGDSYLFTVTYTAGTHNVAGLIACLGNVERNTLDFYSVLTGEKVQPTLNIDFGGHGMLAGEADGELIIWTAKGKRVFICPVSPPFSKSS